MRYTKDVKGLIFTPAGFRTTTVTVRITSDSKGESLSLADEKQRIMLEVPCEGLRDALIVLEGLK